MSKSSLFKASECVFYACVDDTPPQHAFQREEELDVLEEL